MLKEINEAYLRVHRAKEDLFWTTYMGIESNPAEFEKAEKAYKSFISDPSWKAKIDEYVRAQTLDPQELVGLKGWQSFFQCHSIDNPESLALQSQLIELEAQLFQKRATLKLYYTNEKGEKVEASTRQLAENISANPHEGIRRSSLDALRFLEKWVLSNGFIELIKARNAFARSLGHSNYFDYTVLKNERMSAHELFRILDAYEEATRDRNFAALAELERIKGSEALQAHNFRFSMAGDTTRAMDAYLPFAESLERWLKSFHRLGIRYQGAKLTLDLLNRPGKYENGFMHGPEPAFLDEGKWNPARINFTSNATPNQVGSGADGLTTLFHEGGHAAHFANIRQNAPCFSQEFPPTSMAYAETQSMFCDSLIQDADWLWLYARNQKGEAVPEELIFASVRNKQPFFNFRERGILVVPYFERELYTLSEKELNEDHILAKARCWEKQILGIEGPRPLLAIPHLLGGDSSASYHGYLLADMAVYQTRAFFLQRDGFLTDNSNIGPELTQHYWSCGNLYTHDETLRHLTGEGFNPQYLADYGNTPLSVALEEAKELIEKARNRVPQRQSDKELDVDAHIRVVHGSECIADNAGGYAELCRQFRDYILKNYPPLNEAGAQ